MSAKSNVLCALAASTVLMLGSAAAAQAAAAAPAVQAPSTPFDPLHPFAGARTGDAYVARFVTRKPKIVAGDPYGNMSPAQFWRDSWYGQNIGKVAPMSAAKGDGGTGATVRSPYPYKTAEEHYKAWQAAAKGGTRHTQATLPDWSGDWGGFAQGVISGHSTISDVMEATSDAYKPRYTRLLEAEWAGHPWWATQYCLPTAYAGFFAQHGAGATFHFMADKMMVLVMRDKNANDSRYMYTDGRGWLPEDKATPQWYGASQAFWDGDELVVWTGQLRRWAFTHGIGEHSDKLESVERYKRIGDQMIVDITLYDPEAFAFPWHDVAQYRLVRDWTLQPAMFNDCTSTNNVFLNRHGELDERTPDDLGFVDFLDERPWETAFKRWDDTHNKDGSLKPGAGPTK